MGMFIAFVVAVRQVPYMKNPDPKHVVVIFTALAAYTLVGGIITAKQAEQMSAKMPGILNVLVGIAWLIGAYGMATFPT